MGRIAFGIISVLVVAGCVRLGFWQLSRLHARQDRNAEVREQLAHPAVDPARVDSVAPYRRVEASGWYDTSVTVVEVLRVNGGVPGVYLVSPLLLGDGRAVLVERGWVAAPDARSVDAAALAWTDPVRVEGFVTPVIPGEEAYGGGWPVFVRNADPGRVAARVRYPVLPILVRRTGGLDHPEVVPLEPPELTRGPHLNYAVQWFAFAVVGLVGTAAFLRAPRHR